MSVFLSVIMPCRLEVYEGGTTADRVNKFIDSIRSFLYQTHTKCQLIIVADHDPQVKQVLSKFNSSKIHLVEYNEGEWELHKGVLRDIGIARAKELYKGKFPHYITYLDSDDMFNAHHLADISDCIEDTNHEAFYICDNVIGSPPFFGHVNIRKAIIGKYGCIGTSNLIHSVNCASRWEGLNGYGHDFKFAQLLVQEFGMPRHTKTNGYYVRHTYGHDLSPNILVTNN